MQAGAWDVDDTGLEYMPTKNLAERIQQVISLQKKLHGLSNAQCCIEQHHDLLFSWASDEASVCLCKRLSSGTWAMCCCKRVDAT